MPAGLYIDLPFTRPRPSAPTSNIVAEPPRDAYLDALRREIDRRFDEIDGRELVSVYLGGGTASYVPTTWIDELLADIADRRGLADVEVTIEASPLDLERRRLAAWRRAGVTRVILEVESFQPATLQTLGAPHRSADAERAVLTCHAFGQLDYGVDLAFAAPGQTPADFTADLRALDRLGPPGSVFGGEYRPGEGGGADSRRAADMLEHLCEWCAARELRRYEVASFCRPGAESRHNTLHWTGGEYVGVGLGAASLAVEGATARRRRNTTDLATYLADPAEPSEAWGIAPADYLVQRLEFACRSRAGLDLDRLHDQFVGELEEGRLEAADDALEWAADRGLAEWSDSTWRPTDRGLDVADGLAQKLRVLTAETQRNAEEKQRGR